MKIRELRKLFLVFSIIVILLTNNSLVLAQPQDECYTKDLIHHQFVLTMTWSGNEIQQPISPGETREVHLTITYVVTRGAFGKMLLQFLKGRSFPMHLSIENTSDNCTAWIVPENMTGVIDPDEIRYQYSSLFIHVNEDAPGNYSLGWVKIRGTIEDKKGPFNILTLIQGYEQHCVLNFVTGP